MRIFQAIEGNANVALAQNSTWHRNLHEPLVELGHDVHLFSVAEGRRAMRSQDSAARTRFSDTLTETFLREHQRQPFDLFFAYLMDGMVDPAALDVIRKTGVPTCNFSCNNVHQFYLVAGISRHFDYNLHAEKLVRQKFLDVGANPVWWPMASNPKYFKPIDVPRTIDASFVGANYALRARYVAHLLHNGVAAHVYGPGWTHGTTSLWRSRAKRWKYLLSGAVAVSPAKQSFASAMLADHDFRRHLAAQYPHNVHAPVPDDELIALYSRSHVSLGFLEVHEGHDPTAPVTQHLHLREFEAPMCGALYCTGYCDELSEMFEPETEVVTYRNTNELLDKVNFYLQHPGAADKVRAAGRARALRDHTYHRRFQDLFAHLGLSRRSPGEGGLGPVA
jgi:spore maturation protein CgeB